MGAMADVVAPTRVVIADDDVLLREGLAGLLERARFDVVGQCDNATELLELVRDRRPDLAIIDIRMPPTHTREGLDAARTIRAEAPDTAILCSLRMLTSSMRWTCSQAASGPATC